MKHSESENMEQKSEKQKFCPPTKLCSASPLPPGTGELIPLAGTPDPPGGGAAGALGMQLTPSCLRGRGPGLEAGQQ